MISAIGVRNVVENQVDFTNSRNLIIAAVILVCGLGFTNGLTFQVGGASITLTSLAIAAIAGHCAQCHSARKRLPFWQDGYLRYGCLPGPLLIGFPASKKTKTASPNGEAVLL